VETDPHDPFRLKLAIASYAALQAASEHLLAQDDIVGILDGACDALADAAGWTFECGGSGRLGMHPAEPPTVTVTAVHSTQPSRRQCAP